MSIELNIMLVMEIQYIVNNLVAKHNKAKALQKLPKEHRNVSDRVEIFLEHL